MNRRIAVLLVVMVLILAGLVGLYFYLAGGESAEQAEESTGAAGLVHVRTIYTADGENLRRPVGLGATDNGDFYITLKDNSRVIGFDSNGDFKSKWGEQGVEQGQMLAPLAVAANPLANLVYVIDRARLRIIAFNSAGGFQWERPVLNPVGVTLLNEDVVVTTFGPIVRLTSEGEPVSETGTRGFEEGQFDYPRAAVQVPDTEDLVVADTNNTRVQRVELSGEVTATVRWTTGEPPRFQDDPETVFGVPSGVTMDERRRVFVLDGFRYKIDVLDPDSGEIVHSFTDLEGDGPGRFNLPTGIAHLGGDYFAVTDTFNDRVQIIRLLLPEEDTFIARRPWLVYLLPLLLLPLLLPLLRRRVFVTRESLERAREDGDLRLLAGAFRRLHVLPEVAEDFAAVSEEGVDLADYLVTVGERAEAGGADETQRLGVVATPTGWKRVTSPRRLVVCADAEQLEIMREVTQAKVKDLEWVRSEYRMD